MNLAEHTVDLGIFLARSQPDGEEAEHTGTSLSLSVGEESHHTEVSLLGDVVSGVGDEAVVVGGGVVVDGGGADAAVVVDGGGGDAAVVVDGGGGDAAVVVVAGWSLPPKRDIDGGVGDEEQKYG